jgi:hypothetical protein
LSVVGGIPSVRGALFDCTMVSPYQPTDTKVPG